MRELSKTKLAEVITLKESGVSNIDVAKATGISKASVERINKKVKEGQIVAEVPDATDIEAVKNKLASQFSTVMDRIAVSIDAETVEKAGLKDRAIALGVFFDKFSLLKGLATSNVAVKTDIVSAIRSVSSK